MSAQPNRTLVQPIVAADNLANVGAEGQMERPRITPVGSWWSTLASAGGEPVEVVNLATDLDNLTSFGLVVVSQTRAVTTSSNQTTSINALADDTDNNANVGEKLLGTVGRLQGFDGSIWDRLRVQSASNASASQIVGALVAAAPGNWSINHTPVADTVATITRAAGGANVRHLCTSISCSLIGLAAAAETTVLLNLRDGATGAGTILWSLRLQVIPGGTTGIALSGLSIYGSPNTAMTLEFAAAGGADTFESVALAGYDVA